MELLDSEKNLRAFYGESLKLERSRQAYRLEAIRKSKVCDHIVGETYENGGRNIPRSVYRVSQVKRCFKNMDRDKMKILFRWIFKYCPLCGKRIRCYR